MLSQPASSNHALLITKSALARDYEEKKYHPSQPVGIR